MIEEWKRFGGLMLEKISNSWVLFKTSLKILSSDKELLVFPILSAIGTFIITASFILPWIFATGLDFAFLDKVQPFTFVVLFLFYVLQYSVVFLANTALVGAASIRLNGGDPTIKDGLRIAFSRFGPIIGYALIAATVGMILSMLSNKSKGLGRMVVSIIGFAWTVATYLVVPVLALEGVGPIQAIKRSVQLLRQTWGEQITGNLGLGAVFTIVDLLLFIIFIPLMILSAVNEVWIAAGILLFLFIVALTLSGLLKSSLNGIYSAAVYQYATTGQTNPSFDQAMIRNAFQQQR